MVHASPGTLVEIAEARFGDFGQLFQTPLLPDLEVAQHFQLSEAARFGRASPSALPPFDAQVQRLM